MEFTKPFVFFLTIFTLLSAQQSSEQDDLNYRLKAKKSKKGIHLFQEKQDLTKQQKPNQLNVDLRNPSYQSGELSTTEGGVIQNNEMRIQAKNIRYIRKSQDDKLIHKIIAYDSGSS